MPVAARAAVSNAGLLVLFPVGAAALGAGVAAWRRPGPQLTSGIQHFAAGVVFAALGGEVLPDLRREGHLGAVLLGFSAGIALLLALGAYADRQDKAAEQRPRVATGSLPAGLLAAVAIDLLIDGLLVGLGATLGSRQGLVITIALTLEILFLAVSVASACSTGTSAGHEPAWSAAPWACSAPQARSSERPSSVRPVRRFSRRFWRSAPRRCCTSSWRSSSSRRTKRKRPRSWPRCSSSASSHCSPSQDERHTMTAPDQGPPAAVAVGCSDGACSSPASTPPVRDPGWHRAARQALLLSWTSLRGRPSKAPSDCTRVPAPTA